MAEPTESCVIVCESVHDVMALERALKDVEIAVEMIPTPRELTSDCGMALEVPLKDIGRVSTLQQERHLDWRGIFIRDESGFSPVM